ncbi:MAG: 4Fe-4S single cluster domain-containing protein [Lachnospiraceae bacterium]
MLFARMISPIHSLGPGERIGIWLQGCSKNCKGCLSPEMQKFDTMKNIPVEMLTAIIIDEAKRNNCDRLTISGGDPFEQAEELLVFLAKIRPHFSDILLYTGYTLDEINKSIEKSECLKFIDVLIDGRYEEIQNKGSSKLYGSDNQKVYFFNQKLIDDYIDYEDENHLLESFFHEGKVITVGIQRRE